MNIQNLLLPEVQNFVREHEREDEKKLLLKLKLIHHVPSAIVVNQIVGRRKAKLKLPTWYNSQNIVYPPSINLEQCSSEITAKFKARILKEIPGIDFNRVADLTGGFGVDSFFLSSVFNEVNYVEPDETLFEITLHNHSTLLTKNLPTNGTSFRQAGLKRETQIHHHNSSAEEFLVSTNAKFDLVYIDPSRRTRGNEKTFRLADCQPHIIELIPRIFEKTNLILVKTSPLLDLQLGIKELNCVEKIFVVAVDNECREVLFLCRKSFAHEPLIEAINLNSRTSEKADELFSFMLSEEKKSRPEFSGPLTYLYEPNAAILKAGAFKLVANQYSLSKLHQNTHLYTSDKRVEGFPGRTFKILDLVKSESKLWKTHFPKGQANVFTRNYPLRPDQLKKKTGLKDGGENFLIGFTGVRGKVLAAAERLM